MFPALRRTLVRLGFVFTALVFLGVAFWVWTEWPDTNALVGQASRGDVAGARWSLRLGVDPNTASRWGWRLENAGQTPLTVAAEFGRVEIVRLLLANGADVNLLDGGGQTPLSTATRHGQLEVCRLLLDAGAEPNVRTNPDPGGYSGNWTALDWALQTNHAAISELLREHKAIEGRQKSP